MSQECQHSPQNHEPPNVLHPCAETHRIKGAEGLRNLNTKIIVTSPSANRYRDGAELGLAILICHVLRNLLLYDRVKYPSHQSFRKILPCSKYLALIEPKNTEKQRGGNLGLTVFGLLVEASPIMLLRRNLTRLIGNNRIYSMRIISRLYSLIPC